MSRRKFTKGFALIISVITLFVTGRFYKEIDAFFNTPYTIVGLLMASIVALLFYIQWQRLQILRKESKIHYYQNELELERMRGYENISKIGKLEKRIEKYKERNSTNELIGQILPLVSEFLDNDFFKQP